ncbi:MAG: hypothetical protein DMG55_03520 [Acidobacteria bacterium]|nr:MAG: hypothetical protein DMG55_03520 [Acidobacteriota bacterium]
MVLACCSFSMRHLAIAIAVSLALLFSVPHAAAQASRVGATLQGTVSDMSGAVIPNSKVTLHNPLTNQSRTVTTDEQGFFRAEQLPVGTYEIRAEQTGFAPYRQAGVGASLGHTVHLDIVLAPSSASEHVTVNAQTSSLDPSQSSVVSSVDQERIEELPVRSRNYLDFVLLAPGVSSSPIASGVSGSTPLIGSGFTFGGLRSRSNNLSIDGLMAWTTMTNTQVRVVQSFHRKSCRNFKWSTMAFQQSRAEPREVRSMSLLVPGQTQFTATRSYLRRTVHSMRGTRSRLSPASHHFGASAPALPWAAP